jgi:hypothetical protein
VLVALHLFAVTFMALPSASGGLNRRAWKDPTVQGEFAAWAARMRGWGIPVAAPELEDTMWSFATSYEDLRDVVLKPFRPYFATTGTWQSWKMFVAPHRYPSRLEIHVDAGHGFEPVFVERSAEHQWMRIWFDHDRMRAAVFRYGWPHYRTSRSAFADWVARHAREDFPLAEQVRVSFVKYRTPSPEEVRAGIAPEERRELVEIRELAPRQPPP